ncbi:MAG: hypothetical protein K1Y36_04325 [Blastocatellia bacterium]|nr:hypothetical protein [Blastocatellia bacterium]
MKPHFPSNRRLSQWILLVAIAAYVGWLAQPALIAQTKPAQVAKPGFVKSTQQAERFDYVVRADFFAGMAGDQEAFDRAMKACETKLAKQPKHAEALVWHGGGLVFRSGKFFQKGDFQTGTSMWQRGIDEMNEAGTIEPNNVAVLIPRGATLLNASRFDPNPVTAKKLLQTAVDDYENVLRLQTAYFDKLSTHARGELLVGLVEGWQRLGETTKAQAYADRIKREVDDPKFKYIERAQARLENKPVERMSCTGCHVK